MQTSFWKIVSIAGVVGVGTLVVLQVQHQLGQSGPAAIPTEGSGNREIHRTAETKPSEFESSGLFGPTADTRVAWDLPEDDPGLFDTDLSEPALSDTDLPDHQTDPPGNDEDPFGADPLRTSAPEFYSKNDRGSVIRATGFDRDAEIPLKVLKNSDLTADSNFANTSSSATPDLGDVRNVPELRPTVQEENRLEDGIDLFTDKSDANSAAGRVRNRAARGNSRPLLFFSEDAEQDGANDSYVRQLDNGLDSQFDRQHIKPLATGNADHPGEKQTPPAGSVDLQPLPDAVSPSPETQPESNDLFLDFGDERAEIDGPPADELTERHTAGAHPDEMMMFDERTDSSNIAPFLPEEPVDDSAASAHRGRVPLEFDMDSSLDRKSDPLDPGEATEIDYDDFGPLKRDAQSKHVPFLDDELLRSTLERAPARDGRIPELDFSQDNSSSAGRDGRRTFAAEAKLRSPNDPIIRPAMAVPSNANIPDVMRPQLTIQKNAPETATVGIPLEYTVVVTNLGNTSARDIVVADEIPSSVRLHEATPVAEYDKSSRTLVWRFLELEPGDSRKMQVSVEPIEQSVLNGIATVRFKAQVSSTTIVRAPELSLEITGPTEMRLGEEVKYRYTVRNLGDGPASAVMLQAVLPAGLRHPVGDDLEYRIDTLMPDDERAVVLAVVATEPGDYTARARVTAAGDAHDQADIGINIVGQQLQVLCRGPKRRIVGREAVYENIVANDSSFEATDIEVIQDIPDGMKFVSATAGGIYNPEDLRVTWSVEKIRAGGDMTLQVTLLADASGTHESQVTVVEAAGFEAAAQHRTIVDDLHNVSARLSRFPGAIEVGEEFGFDIMVENRGTADATGVQLIMELPIGITVLKAGSIETKAYPEKSGFRYDVIRRIEPNTERTFRVRLKAIAPVENGIVKARVRYQQMPEELVTAESVTAWAETP